MTDDIDKRLGEIQAVLNSLYRRLASMEQRIRHLEKGESLTGTVDGLDGEWTMTPPPRFEP